MPKPRTSFANFCVSLQESFNMDVRRAGAADVSKIAALESEIFSDPWSERAVSDCICKGSMCFVAATDGEIIAYVLGTLIAPEGEIYRIAVRPDKRQRGIGYRLLDYSVRTERGRGLETLFLEVRSKNIPARKLYTAYGFKEISVRKNYYRDPPDDAIVMLRARGEDMRKPYSKERETR